jgi:hypothetical protein
MEDHNRREKDMQLTLKENINIHSLTLQHNILLQATMLLEGREGTLETEKRLYLMLAVVNNIIEEDLMELCNNDDRTLQTIMVEDIEPFYDKCEDEIEGFIDVCQYIEYLLLDRCREIWNNQHSVIGVIDALLTVIGGIGEEDKTKLVDKAIDIAKNIEDKRTEKMEEQIEQTNSKLEELVKTYQRKTENKIEIDSVE